MTAILGSMLRLDDKHGAVRVEDVYDTDIADLWSAMTEPERLARWIAAVEGDLRVGSTVQATFTSTWQGTVRIDECEAPHHLLVTTEAGTDDEGVIEAVLSAEGPRTRLVVEERGLPLTVLHKHCAGWQAHIEDLARYLEGNESSWRARWLQLAPVYETLDVK
jgi:uncharacterized protein YndB with AHSA1/START domain